MKFLLICSTILLVLLTKSNGSGEIKDMDANDVELKPVVAFTEIMLNKAVNSLYTHKIGNVLKAQKQIVSGVKYYLSFQFEETTCLKNKPNNGDCNTTKTEVCSAQIWSRPWLANNKLELLQFNCKSE